MVTFVEFFSATDLCQQFFNRVDVWFGETDRATDRRHILIRVVDAHRAHDCRDQLIDCDRIFRDFHSRFVRRTVDLSALNSSASKSDVKTLETEPIS